MLAALLILVGVGLVAYAACVATLVVAGRRTDAHMLARFIPDCVVLVRRLVGDPRVPRRSKLALVGVAAYLLMPFDLVPDFLPVAGQIDDAILIVLTLRHLMRTSGPHLIAEHWPGPPQGLRALLQLAYSPGGWRMT